ncbi:MAG: stage V sporulation protein AD [Clostridiales bacterium]
MIEKSKKNNTIQYKHGVYIAQGSSAVGPKEGAGPIGKSFDKVYTTIHGGEETWENFECKLQLDAVTTVMKKNMMTADDFGFILGGDLLNQIMITNFTAKELEIPYLGLYNACATMAEAMVIGGMLIDGAYADNLLVVASSHNATSERQYRNPTELGAQRPQTAQWTVTGAGAMILSTTPSDIKITAATIGKVRDFGVKDPNQMGAAMAPAVFSTIKDHFKNTNTSVCDYDLILSGDLGYHGHKILLALFQGEGFEVGAQIQDSGIWIYHSKQDVHSGGSGAGCSAAVWASYLLSEIRKGKYKKILLAGSGALLSPTSLQQGNSIPAICHVVSLINQEVGSVL